MTTAAPRTDGLLELDAAALEKALIAINDKPFRARQILGWIYKKGVYDFVRMTDLSPGLRQELGRRYSIVSARVAATRRSSKDKSAKILIEYPDRQTAEVVSMKRKDRRTVCVSSQAGCRYGCVFCASSKAGFGRSFSAGEILQQVLLARDLFPQERVTHVVVMGMGEPFDNYDAVMKAVGMMNDPRCFGIGARRITVSTAGVVPGIRRYAHKDIQSELSVSLHAANDPLRSKLMPVNRKWPLKELMAECRRYTESTGRIITFEYLLIDGVNNSRRDVQELVSLIGKMPAKFNLIPCNTIAEFAGAGPGRADAERFRNWLGYAGLAATVRFSLGSDIEAACGQLRRTLLKKPKGRV
ncbi:MAG: 23S rRNA (adenine(2503)-C(2))-methyltransferase RlmN [Candidatus Omnitrophica bacterium]|nr:23S rRNA (adenine(2503)-C(2))-methyltransferase RlmN [Candidatus Omnitrophota bacterium]